MNAHAVRVLSFGFLPSIGASRQNLTRHVVALRSARYWWSCYYQDGDDLAQANGQAGMTRQWIYRRRLHNQRNWQMMA